MRDTTEGGISKELCNTQCRDLCIQVMRSVGLQPFVSDFGRFCMHAELLPPLTWIQWSILCQMVECGWIRWLQEEVGPSWSPYGGDCTLEGWERGVRRCAQSLEHLERCGPLECRECPLNSTGHWQRKTWEGKQPNSPFWTFCPFQFVLVHSHLTILWSHQWN